MSVRVSYKKQFLLGIMFLAVILVVIEGIATAWYYTYTCNIEKTEVIDDLDPDIRRQMCLDNRELVTLYYPIMHLKPNQHLKTVNINAEGFRGPEIMKEKPEDTFRIFVLGGSTVFVGASDDTTIPGYLQKKFESENPELNVEVVNAGIEGAFSFNEAQYIKSKLLDYEPDMFVIYDGWNDVKLRYSSFEDVREGDEIQDDPAEQLAKQGYFLLRNYFSFYKTPQFAVEVKNSIAGSEVRDAEIKPYEEHSPEMAAQWKNMWAEICELGKEEGFDSVIVLQPFLGTGNRNLTEYERQNFIKLEHGGLIKAYEDFADVLDELDSHCTETVDLRGVFDGISSPIYWDGGHTIDEAKKIVADKIYEATLPLVLERSEPPAPL